MKIILSGGGTLGPVVPLLAITEACKQQGLEVDFIWVGTKNGPEKDIVAQYDIPFYTMIAGKWRRYFSFWNVVDIFKIILAFFRSFFFLWQHKPNLLISGGGFVSVPLHWAAAVLSIPTWIHQQDVEPGLANRLMAKTAKKITTAIREGADNFDYRKTEWLGNPSRDLGGVDKNIAYNNFNIPVGSPVIFALGGGTGSEKINQWIIEALPSWSKSWHVIHLTGKERRGETQEMAASSGAFANYHVYKFFTHEMKDAFALADVVIARAGFSTITELASLSKAAVLLPMPESHQEKNVKILADNNAVISMNQKTDNGLKLAQVVKQLMSYPAERKQLGDRLNKILPRAKAERIVEIIKELTKV